MIIQITNGKIITRDSIRTDADLCFETTVGKIIGLYPSIRRLRRRPTKRLTRTAFSFRPALSICTRTVPAERIFSTAKQTAF